MTTILLTTILMAGVCFKPGEHTSPSSSVRDDLLESATKRRSELRALYIVQTVNSESVIAAELAREYLDVRWLVSLERTFAFKEGRRYFKMLQPETIQIIPSRRQPAGESAVQRMLPHLERLWDGEKLTTQTGGRIFKRIIQIDQLNGEFSLDNSVFDQTYLRDICMAIPCVLSPQQNAEDELCQMVESGVYEQDDTPTDVEGRSCIRLISPREELYLDPESGPTHQNRP